MLRVCIAGATGWTGSAVAAAVEAADDLELAAGVSRSHPGSYSSVAEALDAVAAAVKVPVDETLGERDARGATVGGTQVHSLRLPSFTVSTEVVFAAEGERLSLRHDAGESAAPYVAGTLVAIRAVPSLVGLTRG